MLMCQRFQVVQWERCKSKARALTLRYVPVQQDLDDISVHVQMEHSEQVLTMLRGNGSILIVVDKLTTA